MMYPRLFLARQILSDEGVICISIDDNEVHNLRLLMDEIFGEENFAAQVSIVNNPKGRGLREHFAICHDYLLVYTRTALSESIGIEKTVEQIEREYPNIEGDRRFRYLELRNTHRQFNRETRRKMWYSIYVNGLTGAVSIDPAEDYVEVLPVWDDGLEGCWTWGKPAARRDATLLVGRLIDGRWKIFRKAYSEDDQGNVVRKKLQTVWNERKFHTEIGQEELDALIPGRVFDSPKPVGFLKQIIDACTRANEGDIILDFFAGSGTTGHATMALNDEDGGNRRFILVQFPEQTPANSNARKAGFDSISQITRLRLRKAISQLEAQPESLLTSGRDTLHFGFRAFRLTASNFLSWQSSDMQTADEYVQKMALFNDPLLPGWLEPNVLFEIMEHEGYSLTSRIVSTGVPGMYRVFDRDDDWALWITLADRVDLEELQRLKVGKEDLTLCVYDG